MNQTVLKDVGMISTDELVPSECKGLLFQPQYKDHESSHVHLHVSVEKHLVWIVTQRGGNGRRPVFVVHLLAPGAERVPSTQVDTAPRGKIRAHWESPRREGYPRPPHLFQPQPREEWQRVDALCQERRNQFQEQERKRERERDYQEEKKRSGGMVNDGMGPFEGNWDQVTPKERLYNERLYIGQMKPAE